MPTLTPSASDAVAAMEGVPRPPLEKSSNGFAAALASRGGAGVGPRCGVGHSKGFATLMPSKRLPEPLREGGSGAGKEPPSRAEGGASR